MEAERDASATDDEVERELAAFGLDRHDDDTWLGLARRALAPTVSPGRLGAYEIEAEIGRGAQGAVYKARQPLTQRAVAIKRLSAAVVRGQRARERFEREIEVLTRLAHPNIVTVHAAELVEGEPILIMEWIDGEPIDRWARRDPPRSVRAIVAGFLAACAAVAHAHRRGVLHCDLKPSNVLIDREDRARVLDFGLAKLLSPGTESATHGFVGTPAYAPPEQIDGRWDAVDTRSDIYALGAVLFALLAGRPPFDGELEFAELACAVRSGHVDGWSQLRARAGSELESIVRTALALDPDRRYPSVDALAADLQRWLGGEAVLAHPPSALYRLRKRVARHGLASAIGAGASLLTLAFTVTVTAMAVRLERKSVELEGSLARESAALSAAQSESKRHESAAKFLFESISDVGRIRDPASNESLRRLLESAAGKLERGALQDQPEVESGLRVNLELGYRGLGLYEQAELHGRRAVQLAEMAEPADAALLSRALMHFGGVLDARGKLSEAEVVLRRALEVQSRCDGPESFESLSVLSNLAATLESQRRYDEAEAYYAHGLAVLRRTRPADHASIGGFLRNLGFVQIALGRYADAERNTLEALAQYELVPKLDLNAAQRARRNMARVFSATGRHEQALAWMRDALEQWTHASGPEHPVVALENARYAVMLVDAAEIDAGCELFAANLAKLDQLVGASHPESVWARIELGRALTRRGERSRAEKELRAAASSAAALPDGAEATAGAASAAFAQCLIDVGRTDEAARELTQALERLARLTHAHAPTVERCRAELTELLETCSGTANVR